MKAIIRLDVPDWQIGQEVKVYFPDTMCVTGTCEDEENSSKISMPDNAIKMMKKEVRYYE